MLTERWAHDLTMAWVLVRPTLEAYEGNGETIHGVDIWGMKLIL